MTNIGFAGRDGVFTLENAENITGLYLPLAGIGAGGRAGVVR